FPGHAAWISGDWKLHRIQGGKSGKARWELFNLASDHKEERDLLGREPKRAKQMQVELGAWLQSVARSFNGEDY
ncbi:MAG: N-acetylgalactosamine 6-sulfate sulfatase, partial [Roseibacillus sp.]